MTERIDISFPTPEEIEIIGIPPNVTPEKVGEIIEEALRRRDVPLFSKGESISIILIKQGGGGPIKPLQS
jgi:hypothetical protein